MYIYICIYIYIYIYIYTHAHMKDVRMTCTMKCSLEIWSPTLYLFPDLSSTNVPRRSLLFLTIFLQLSMHNPIKVSFENRLRNIQSIGCLSSLLVPIHWKPGSGLSVQINAGFLPIIFERIFVHAWGMSRYCTHLRSPIKIVPSLPFLMMGTPNSVITVTAPTCLRSMCGVCAQPFQYKYTFEHSLGSV